MYYVNIGYCIVIDGDEVVGRDDVNQRLPFGEVCFMIE